MRFSKGTAASLIATNSMAAVVFASSSSSLSTTTAIKSSSEEAANASQPHQYHTHHDKDHADAGILIAPRRVALTPPPKPTRPPTNDFGCSQGFVECLDGEDKKIKGQSCEESCIDESGKSLCCTGAGSCGFFTGKVCKDSASCIGYKSCYNAYIFDGVSKSCAGERACEEFGRKGDWLSSVTGSCNADSACFKAGTKRGYILKVDGSCNGKNACKYFAVDYAKVGNVKDSCNAEDACIKMGYKRGTIGAMTSSCNGNGSCKDAVSIFGYVKSMVNSCTAANACVSIAYDGFVGVLQDSCTAEYACKYTGARTGGYRYGVKSITKSCTEDSACHYLGSGGQVRNIKDACSGSKSCYRLGSDGKVGNVVGSCTASSSCEYLAYKGDVGGLLQNCCKGENECKSLTEFPGGCQVSEGLRTAFIAIPSSYFNLPPMLIHLHLLLMTR